MIYGVFIWRVLFFLPPFFFSIPFFLSNLSLSVLRRLARNCISWIFIVSFCGHGSLILDTTFAQRLLYPLSFFNSSM